MPLTASVVTGPPSCGRAAARRAPGGKRKSLRVDRRTVRAWLDGEAVPEATARRLAALHGLLAGPGSADLAGVLRAWRVRTSGGRSLKELLTAEAVDLAAVRLALAEIVPLAGRGRPWSGLRGVFSSSSGCPSGSAASGRG